MIAALTSLYARHRDNTYLHQLFNAGLRLVSLASKLLLTLYMGKFLGLTEMGTYGLVAAYVAVAMPLLGMRLDYVVSREIVDAPPDTLATKMRDQAVLYGINYIVFGLAAASVLLIWPQFLDWRVLLIVALLAITENMGAVSAANFVALKRPITSTFLFFIRSALWVFPVIALGWLFPQLRTADFIFVLWLGGVILSLALTFWLWRDLPWRATLSIPVSWSWIRRSTYKALPIWIGSVAVAASANLDRFVIELNLGRDYVGILSFYGSFIVAMAALLQNGVIAYAYPRLVSFYRDGQMQAFRHEVRRMFAQALVSTAILALIIGTLVPMLGTAFSRPEFATYASVLWAMLLSSWLKAAGECFYCILYARHQDRPIWIGNLAALAVSALATIVAVHFAGFHGLGYAAIINGVFILGWRAYWGLRYLPPAQEPKA
jgi:O-antigen/teichoic acid export membrane protein